MITGKGKHAKRNDLQGLRFLAILSVLLFHIWPEKFPNGYLGVDIFFVLSGYLMCTILSSTQFGSTSINKFYFRRIKRIFPTYYFIIISTLLAGYLIQIDTFYPNLVSDSTSASFFTSNIFNLPISGYFAVNNQYPLFLHTWSLSVEVQFYLIVPWIFWITTKLREISKPMGYVMATGICGISFGFQIYFRKDTNISHMSMAARMWQFMLGFITAFTLMGVKLHEYTLLAEQDEDAKVTHIYSVQRPIFCRFLKEATTIILSMLLLSNVIENVIVTRLSCSILSALFIYMEEESSLSNELMVYIGDVSYSIYLVHWPIVKLMNYNHIGKSVDGFENGICAITLSIVLGCFVEHIFIKISSYLTKWTRLLILLLLLGTTIFSFQLYISLNIPREDVNKAMLEYKDNRTLRYNDTGYVEYVYDLYRRREEILNMTKKEIEYFNLQMRDYIDYNAVECRDRQWPKIGKILGKKEFYNYVCMVEGTGTKEMVIIGDSVARDVYMGVQMAFKDVYSRLTLVSKRGYHPFYRKAGLNNDSNVLFTNVLKKWDRPIDVLFVQFSITTFETEKSKKQYKDKYPMFLQLFINHLQPLVNDVILLGYPEVTVDTFGNIEDIFKFIREDRPFDGFHMSWRNHKKRKAWFTHVMENIECTKCLKVDMGRSMCSTITDQCSSVLSNGLILRRDNIHTMLTGSFFYADEFRYAFDRKFEIG